MDKRIIKTKKLLRASILNLIEKGENYDQITIEKITETAIVGRTTFYLHYKDKNELLNDSISHLIEEIFDEIYSEKRIALWKEKGIDPRKYLFEHAYENKQLYQLLFNEQICGNVIVYFHTHLTELFSNRMEEIQMAYQIEPIVPNTINASYSAGGIIFILKNWILDGLKLSPEEIYNYYYSLIELGSIKNMGMKE